MKVNMRTFRRLPILGFGDKIMSSEGVRHSDMKVDPERHIDGALHSYL